MIAPPLAGEPPEELDPPEDAPPALVPPLPGELDVLGEEQATRMRATLRVIGFCMFICVKFTGTIERLLRPEPLALGRD